MIIGMVAVVAVALLSNVLITVVDHNDGSGRTAVVLMILGFGLTAIYLLLHYYRYRIIIDHDQLVIHNELGRTKTIAQEDIRSVDHQKTFNMIVVYNRWGNKVRISPMYSRFLELIPEEKWTEKLKSKFS